MTESAINPNINDRYPYPGVDNSLQGFRDNFSIIKSSLTTAKSEISDLLTNVVRTDTQIIDLHGNVLSNVVLKNTTDYRYTIDGLQTVNFDIDYNNGSYQVAQIGADLTINFINFPTDTAETTKLGSMRLHLCADANSRRVQFTASNSIIKYNAGFPFVDTTKLRIPGSATKDPVILDVWQVNNGTPTSTLFIKHDGQFVHYIAKPVPVAATLALTQDTGTNSSDGITSNGQITVSGLEAGATWEYSTNNGNSWTTGTGATFTLSDGTYPAGSVQVKQTNTVGNSSIGSTSSTIVVDTTPPSTTPPTTYADSFGSIQNAASVSPKTDDTTPGINIGSVGTNTPALYVDGDLTTAAYDPAAGTLRPVTALAEGIHTFTYTLTDDLGNTSQQSSPLSITIDTTAPVISSIVPSWGSSLVTSEMSTDGTVVISTTGVEDGQLASVTLNSVTYTGTTASNTANVTIPAAALGVLVDGTTYAITASVQDLAGNQSATASTSFDVNPITVEIDTVTFTTPFADTTITLKPYNPGAGITHIGTAYEVSAYDDFRSLVATSGNDWSFLTSYTIVGILSPATTYYARAKCLNGGSNFGWTAWSPVFQFTTTTAANHPVTGSIIITGNLTVGSVLTANASALADLDILGPFSYSWYSDVDPTLPIPGETSTTYTIRPVDETRNVGCAVTYYDGSGYFEIAVTYVGPIIAAAPVYGQPMGGGYYAGDIVDGGVTYKLIVAPKASGMAFNALKWKTSNTAAPAATQTLTNGVAASNAMNSSEYPAAYFCKGLNTGGFTDWYLPARDELEVLYRNLKPTTPSNTVGNRSATGFGGDGLGNGTNANSSPVGAAYTSGSPAQTGIAVFKTGGTEALVDGFSWSSTESSVITAWGQDFNTGYQTAGLKDSDTFVRAIRRVL